MGACFSNMFKNSNDEINFNNDLLTPLNNEINDKIDSINEKIINIENQIIILESNTQNNIKLLSQDIHHINSKINN